MVNNCCQFQLVHITYTFKKVEMTTADTAKKKEFFVIYSAVCKI